jgi:hypothetical protein
MTTAAKLCVQSITIVSPEGLIHVSLRDGRIELDYAERTDVREDMLWPEETETLAGLLGCSEAEAVKLVGMLTD